MARRNRRRNGGVSAQRAPMSLRLLTTRYAPSTRPLNLNASSRQHRRENWDDWVAVNEHRDLDTLVSALKTWFPSLDNAFSDSEWEDVESLRSKRVSLDQSSSKGKGKTRAREDDDEERRPSTSSLQSVLEEDESETSGVDADVSAEGSSHLNSTSTLTSSSRDTTLLERYARGAPARQMLPFSRDDHGGRSPGASYITPRSYLTLSLSEESSRTARPSFSTHRSPGASYATPRSALPSFSTDQTAARPSFSSQRTEREKPSPERPSFSTERSLSPLPYTPERYMSFSTEHSIEFTPIARPLNLSPSISRSLMPSPYSDYADVPDLSTRRSLHTAASFSTQRSAASVANASMGLALRLQQVSALPTLTALPSFSSSGLRGSTTPSTLSSPTSPPITPPRGRTPGNAPRPYTPDSPGTPNTSSRCTPGGTSAFESSFPFPTDTSAATPSSLLPSMPSHMVLSPSRSLSSFATTGPRHSLPSKTLLHDLDAQSLSYSRSLLSLPSVPSMAGVGPFLNDLDVISLGGGTHDLMYDSHTDTNPSIRVKEHGAWAKEAAVRRVNGVGVAGQRDTSAAATTTQATGSGRTPRTDAEEYAMPVFPRLPTRPLASSGDAADGSGRMARTLRNIQSLSSLRPAASLQSLRAKFGKQPSEGASRPRAKSKGKKRPTLPTHYSRAPPSTPSKYRGGVPGSPGPQRSALLPKERLGASPLRSNSNGNPKSPKPKTDLRGKVPKPSARLRLRRPKSHLLRHEATTTEAEESERRLLEHLELHGQRREGRLKALRLRGLL
ncbi:hypothetical protein CspHIS471_0506380 [Cutaneotrichosporon sp. HIS471]|nr:hypothetical protein CspHIS471_0506380 [Cutaneotrichosporon sp. HIS471]